MNDYGLRMAERTNGDEDGMCGDDAELQLLDGTLTGVAAASIIEDEVDVACRIHAQLHSS